VFTRTDAVLDQRTDFGGRGSPRERDRGARCIGDGKEPTAVIEDEFVRNKIAISWVTFLAGCRFLGHVIAVKPGHAANAEMTKSVAKTVCPTCSPWRRSGDPMGLA